MLNSMSQDYFEAVRERDEARQFNRDFEVIVAELHYDRDEARRLAEYYRGKYACASDQGNDDLPRFSWEPDEDE
jgi:hypothetical protein